MSAQSPLSGKRLALIGAGNMGTAIVGGLIGAGLVRPEQVKAADPNPERRKALTESHGIETVFRNLEAVLDTDIVLLAVKPQNAIEVMDGIGHVLAPEQLVVSIMAGTPTSLIERYCSAPVPVVRVMPNTPALIGCGATALAPGAHATDEHLELARAIFDPIGITVEVEESQLDAVTGLSGSGPGFIFYFVEALVQAGMDVGLTQRVSKALVYQTLLGSARLLFEDPRKRTPAELREAVTSPGGTTAAGLKILREGLFADVVRRAVRAATARAHELGQQEQQP